MTSLADVQVFELPAFRDDLDTRQRAREMTARCGCGWSYTASERDALAAGIAHRETCRPGSLDRHREAKREEERAERAARRARHDERVREASRVQVALASPPKPPPRPTSAVCERCGETYKPRQRGQRRCSECSVSGAAHTKRITRQCLHCGEPYLVPLGKGHNRSRYCSTEHAHATKLAKVKAANKAARTAERDARRQRIRVAVRRFGQQTCTLGELSRYVPKEYRPGLGRTLAHAGCRKVGHRGDVAVWDVSPLL